MPLGVSAGPGCRLIIYIEAAFKDSVEGSDVDSLLIIVTQDL